MTWDNTPVGWTDREIHTLKTEWGRLTARELSDIIGRSRNAVIGMAHRLDLPKQQNPVVRTDPVIEAEVLRRWKKVQSGTKVARQMGMKRQTVDAIVKRLRSDTPSRPAKPRPVKRRRARSTATHIIVAPVKEAPLPEPSLVARSSYPAPEGYRGPRCQWIPGEPSGDDACKCGGMAVSGRPYCWQHEAISVRRSSSHEERVGWLTPLLGGAKPAEIDDLLRGAA